MNERRLILQVMAQATGDALRELRLELDERFGRCTSLAVVAPLLESAITASEERLLAALERQAEKLRKTIAAVESAMPESPDEALRELRLEMDERFARCASLEVVTPLVGNAVAAFEERLLVALGHQAEELRKAIAEVESALPESIEVTHEDIVAAVRNDADLVQSLRGDRGDKGDPGAAGLDGAGIHAEAWQAGKVYREGAVVMYAIGKIARARVDTVATPGRSSDWERIGTFGLEHRGLRKDGDSYEPGDIFVEDGSSFLVTETGPQMLVKAGQRGAKGDPGPRGRNADEFFLSPTGQALLAAKAVEAVATLGQDEGTASP